MLCIDNSEWMRAEDYSPNRWQAQCEAAFLFLNGKPEDSVGVVTMSGKRPICHLPPTQDKHKTTGALKDVKLTGEVNHKAALDLAQLILRNRTHKIQKPRIVWFVGSPVEESLKEILSIAHSCRKNNIAVDVIDFGEMSSLKSSKLDSFVADVNRRGTSHYISCGHHDQMSMSLLSLFTHKESAFSVWQRTFGHSPPVVETNEQRRERLKKEEAEATKKAEENGMVVLQLPSPTNPRCSRAVLDLMHYRYVTRQIAIPVTFTLKNNKLVVTVPSSTQNKQLVASFKAGRMTEGEGDTISPQKEKGQVSLWTLGDSSLLFQWKSRTTDSVEFSTKLTRGMVGYHAVAECTTGKVYLLELKKRDSIHVIRHFFWSQEPSDSVADKEFWFAINDQLEREPDESELSLGDIDLPSLIDKESLIESLDLKRLFGSDSSLLSSLMIDSLMIETADEDSLPPLPDWRKEQKSKPLSRKHPLLPGLLPPRRPQRKESEDLPSLEYPDDEDYMPSYSSIFPPRHARSKSSLTSSRTTHSPFFPSANHLRKFPPHKFSRFFYDEEEEEEVEEEEKEEEEEEEREDLKGGIVVTPSNIQDILLGKAPRKSVPKKKTSGSSQGTASAPPIPSPIGSSSATSPQEEPKENPDSVLVTASNVSEFLKHYEDEKQ